MYEILKRWPMIEEESTEANPNFHDDEEPEQEDQNEDMKVYQDKLNQKIDVLVDAL